MNDLARARRKREFREAMEWAQEALDANPLDPLTGAQQKAVLLFGKVHARAAMADQLAA